MASLLWHVFLGDGFVAFSQLGLLSGEQATRRRKRRTCPVGDGRLVLGLSTVRSHQRQIAFEPTCQSNSKSTSSSRSVCS